MSFTQDLSLSYGALKKILDGENMQNVVLQILGYKQIPGSNNSRFRLLLNDGVVLLPYAILATQLNSLIYDKNLEKFTIFKLKDYALSELLSNKKVIICIDIEVVLPGSEVNEKLSKTSNILNSTANQSAASFSFSISAMPKNSSSFSIETERCPSTSYVAQNWDTARNTAKEIPLTESLCISSISSLTPYRNKWTVKARITYKTHIVSYSNSRGQGKYFAFYLLDSSGEIRATAFNEHAEKLYESLKLNNVYLISNAIVKTCRENRIVKCDFELMIDKNTKIEPALCDETSVPSCTFNFHTIAEIGLLPKDSFIDVIGICVTASELTKITIKSNNREISKKTLHLFDKSKHCIPVTIWGADAENFKFNRNLVVSIKNAKITSFGGCSLSVTSMSMIYIDPDICETCELKSWFQNLNDFSVTSNISPKKVSQNWKTLAEIFPENSSYNVNVPTYYVTKATIVTVKKEKCMYQACPILSCLKKVVNLNNGLYMCNKCNKEYSNFKWTLLLSVEVADFTGSQWTIAFKEAAENLIGIESEELSKVKCEDEDKYYDILSNLDLKSYIFKMRSNLETFNEDTRLKTSILNVSPVNPISYTKKLMTDIRKMSRILNNS